MAIEFRCENPDCNRLLSGPDDWAGRRIDCPHCGRGQRVPAASATTPSRFARPVPRGGDEDEGALTWLRYSLAAHKGKLIGLLVLAVVVGAAWMMFYTLSTRSDDPSPGGSPNIGDSYVGGLLNARRKAEALVSDTNLRSLHVTLTNYAVSNRSRFPASLRLMAREMGAASALIQTPAGEMLGYVPGQRISSPARNILVYSPAPGPDGARAVLRVDGSIERLAEDEFQSQLARQGVTLAATQPSAP